LKTLELAASREELCGKRFVIELDSANIGIRRNVHGNLMIYS